MLGTEIMEMLLKYCDGNVQDAIVLANNLVEDIEINQQKLINSIAIATEELGIQENKCPLCGSDVILIDTYEEDRGECLGQPCTEKIYIYGCESDTCNYTKQ